MTRAATLCLQAGADGIVHPARTSGTSAGTTCSISRLPDWPDREFNIEGNPFHNLLDVAREVVQQGLPLPRAAAVVGSRSKPVAQQGARIDIVGEVLLVPTQRVHACHRPLPAKPRRRLACMILGGGLRTAAPPC